MSRAAWQLQGQAGPLGVGITGVQVGALQATGLAWDDKRSHDGPVTVGADWQVGKRDCRILESHWMDAVGEDEHGGGSRRPGLGQPSGRQGQAHLVREESVAADPPAHPGSPVDRQVCQVRASIGTRCRLVIASGGIPGGEVRPPPGVRHGSGILHRHRMQARPQEADGIAGRDR